MLAGIGVVRLIGMFAGWQTILSSCSLSFASPSIAAELFFAYYRCAAQARLDAISALHYH